MPTENPQRTFQAAPIPQVLGSDPAAGTIAFVDRSGLWRFDGASGGLAVLGVGTGGRSDRHVLGVASSLDYAPIFDTRTNYTPRLLFRDTALPLSVDTSADSTRVAYLGPDRKLRVAFQQPYANVDGRVVAPSMTFSIGSTLRMSPSGRTIAITGQSLAESNPNDPLRCQCRLDGTSRDLWIVDVETGAAREILCTAAPCPAGLSPAQMWVAVLSWSPDEHYLLVRAPSVASGVDSEGTDHFMVDVRSGERTILGPAVDIDSWRSWTAPHTLFIASGKVSTQPGTMPTRLRRWSPEGGIDDLTSADTPAFSPSIGTDSKELFFIQGVDADRQVLALDTTTGITRSLPRDPAFAVDAVRVSEDGLALLELRRNLATKYLELWLSSPDGAIAHPLVRFGTPLPQPDDIWLLRLRDVNLDHVAWNR